MTRTVQRQETALALDDLDAVVGGGGSQMTIFHPVAIMATSGLPTGFAPTQTTPSATNNYGLANHFDLAFPMAHDTAHVAQGVAPSQPGVFSVPGAVSAPDPSTAPALSLLPGMSGAPATSPTSAPAATTDAAAPGDAGGGLFLGLPGGIDAAVDPTHGDAGHLATSDWAPGSSADASHAATDASHATDSWAPGAHADTSQPATNDWAPGSFAQGDPAGAPSDSNTSW